MAIKYKWLVGVLKELIEKDMAKGIHKLPTEAELCRKYKVSRQTVRLSLSVLEQEGLILKKKGSGSYITGLSTDPTRNQIGILISDEQEYIYPALLNDIHQVFAQSGFTEKIFVTDNRHQTEREILCTLLKNPPRGILVEGCKSALPNPNLSLYQSLMKKGTSVVFLHNYYPSLMPSTYVKDDNLSGSALLVRHLALQGHKSIGGIFKWDDLQGIERFQGFTEAMKDCGLEVFDEWVGWYGSRELDGLLKQGNTDFLKRFIRDSLKVCTAVVCYNDVAAYYLQRELRNAGYRLPEDMAVTAFDNTYLSTADTLGITTLSHIPHEMGEKAAHTLLNKLKGLPASSQEVPWQLTPKASTQTKLV